MADDDKAPAATQPQAPATDADIAKAVEQLDAERFADRQAAGAKLEAAGKAAIGALEKAALGDSLEATTRAVDLLQKLGKSSDDAARQAALAALERLAKSDRPAGNRAQEALNALQPARAPALVAPGGIRGNLRIMGGTVQIQGVQIGGGVSKISISNVNGVKRIEAEDNGRKVTIDEDPQNGIKMEVATRKDGKDVTEKYQARNADELKEKFPEAHKLYKQYSEGIAGRVGAIQVGAGGAVRLGGRGAVRVGPATAPAVVPPAGVARSVPISITTLLMKRLADQLEALQQAGGLNDATPAERESLKKQAEELKRQISDLEKQLDQAAKADAEKK